MAYLTFYNPYYQANRDEKCNCVPASNVFEGETEYRIEMALPGVNKEDIHIKYENGLLRVSVEGKNDNKEDYERREFDYYGSERVFRTGERVNTDQIAAKYENGVLVLTLPKKEAYIKKPAYEIAVN
jgi:HSP20 family protein